MYTFTTFNGKYSLRLNLICLIAPQTTPSETIYQLPIAFLGAYSGLAPFNVTLQRSSAEVMLRSNDGIAQRRIKGFVNISSLEPTT